MGLAESVLARLKGIARTSNLKRFKDYEAALLIFDTSKHEEIIKGLSDILDEVAKEGEVISSILGGERL
jgi:hypothetical protein